MGMPAPKRPKRLTTRIKGKPVEVDLRKSGIGNCKVRVDIIVDRGHSIVELVKVEEVKEDELDS